MDGWRGRADNPKAIKSAGETDLRNLPFRNRYNRSVNMASLLRRHALKLIYHGRPYKM